MARVLIVDDDRELVKVWAIAIEAAGHQVACAHDPAAGLQAARAFRPGLVILDYHMPGDTGAHLFESFRRNQETARTPVLFVSGSAKEEDLLGEVAEAGLCRFLPKPFGIDDLYRTLSEMLGGSELKH